mmetsp:Transcript_3297/g.6507  ORF Transcript_3297/g.6507 Transcript_3297/m.6507 type:complete len:115 (+) Transcript_3297:305-649(+)
MFGFPIGSPRKLEKAPGMRAANIHKYIKWWMGAEQVVEVEDRCAADAGTRTLKQTVPSKPITNTSTHLFTSTIPATSYPSNINNTFNGSFRYSKVSNSITPINPNKPIKCQSGL